MGGNQIGGSEMGMSMGMESYGMEGVGLWQAFIGLGLWWLLFGWPCVKILRRIGFSGWWVLITFVPLANIIALWILATSRWPRDQA